MFEQRVKTYNRIIKYLDLFVIYFSLNAAALVSATNLGQYTWNGIAVAIPHTVFVIMMDAVLFFCHNMVANFYYLNSPRSYLHIIKLGAPKILIVALGDAGLLFVARYWAPFMAITLYFILIYAVGYAILNLAGRLLIYSYFRKMNVGERNTRNIVIVGANKRSRQLSDYLGAHPLLGYNLLGFIDDQKVSEPDVNHLGAVADFGQIIKENVVDSVVIALPIRSFYDTILDLINQAEEQGIAVNYLTDLFDAETVHKAHYQLGPHSAVMMYSSPLEDWRMFCKRIMDLVAASVLLILLSPLFLMIAILIKATSPGPVYFKQQRIGYNKRLFDIYKFRTMVQGAADMQEQLVHLNEMDGPVFKIENDPRITPIGKFLRRTSLDEFPQLINVIRGEMSLVGPRPLSRRDYLRLSEDWVRKRFSIMPGCTCYWQISDRNKSTFHEWMMLDMKYIENWSLWNDFTILVRTIPAVLLGTGM